MEVGNTQQIPLPLGPRQAEDGSCHARGSVPQGLVEPLPPLPRPGGRIPRAPTTEVTPRVPQGGLGGVCHTLSFCPLERLAWIAFNSSLRQRIKHPDVFHRQQRAVFEELSGPLELPEPLPGLVDGSMGSPYPGRVPRSSPYCLKVTSEGSQPASPTQSLLSLDYGIRPKHPWPRGPRPLLSRAQQRKRDGPDMAEYYYNA